MSDTLNHANTYLFVPANRTERISKALMSGADVVIVDLEDAVPTALKASARTALEIWLKEHPEQEICIRVNAKNTPWFHDDLQLANFANVKGLVIPKTETAQDLFTLSQRDSLTLYPLIETALGFSNIREIARVKQVHALMFGSIDFQVDLNMQGGYHELLAFRNEFVLASKLAGIAPPIDGVTVDFLDQARLALETQQAKNLGFAGKLCIHPKQLQTVKQVFLPTELELAWARRVLDAVAESQGQAVSLDGKMVDLPVILQAQKILQQPRQ